MMSFCPYYTACSLVHSFSELPYYYLQFRICYCLALQIALKTNWHYFQHHNIRLTSFGLHTPTHLFCGKKEHCFFVHFSDTIRMRVMELQNFTISCTVEGKMLNCTVDDDFAPALDKGNYCIVNNNGKPEECETLV